MTVWISLVEIDRTMFHYINGAWANAVFDVILPFVRNKMVWLPLYIFIISYFIVNYGRRGYYAILFLILSVVSADSMSSKVIKPFVHRLRPCNDLSILDERLLVRCGVGYSFPSSHATNHFAIAVFLILLLGHKHRWITPVLLGWASLISYAQVYVGVHYPIDVFCGAILGTVIAYGVHQLFLLVLDRV